MTGSIRGKQMQWEQTKEWFLSKTCPFPFLGLSLQCKGWMTLTEWQCIERKEVARVKTWHTKQGIYRKKILPNVRDDMEDPTCEF